MGDRPIIHSMVDAVIDELVSLEIYEYGMSESPEDCMYDDLCTVVNELENHIRMRDLVDQNRG